MQHANCASILFRDPIGEVGIDFSREGRATKDRQLESFRHVAKRLAQTRKFVTVHSRGAEREVLNVLRDAKVSPVVLHWYSGPLGVLEEALSDGHLFSVNPAMTASESGRKVIARIPKEKILTETDGPYVKILGKAAKPADVRVVEKYLSDYWQTPLEAVRKIIWRNFESTLPVVR